MSGRWACAPTCGCRRRQELKKYTKIDNKSAAKKQKKSLNFDLRQPQVEKTLKKTHQHMHKLAQRCAYTTMNTVARLPNASVQPVCSENVKPSQR